MAGSTAGPLGGTTSGEANCAINRTPAGPLGGSNDGAARLGEPLSRPQALGHAAVRALYAELALAPKPGLVSFEDSGSHADMHAGHFLRSLFALRHYFSAIAQAGFDGAGFAQLETLGQAAEARMLRATGGINTHRGGIFLLGLLCAAGGRLLARQQPLTPERLRTSLQQGWGPALRERAERARAAPARSNGQCAARLFGLRSAGDEAADGLPTLFDDVAPLLRATRAAGHPEDAALVQTLFATLAVLDDTNLVHRGGLAGLRFARNAAANFMAAGGVARPGWREHAQAVHHAFVLRRLSPGGSADLLAAAHWVEALATHADTCPGAIATAVTLPLSLPPSLPLPDAATPTARTETTCIR